jgi:glycine/D-amino acid oxidase-like deaminating enzyme/glycine cleavage system aminomethyltransferase T
MDLPARSEIVVIGGGVVGCSIAYQLARRGKTDVTVLERRRLTEGSTWHAAGLVGQLRSSSNLTRLMRWSTATYQTLERETGYATGWRPVGSVRVAASDDRWAELRRLVTTARSFGFEVSLISPAEARELFPLLSTDGIRGATWVPSDGYADPSQLTQSFAAGARAAGVGIIQNCRVRTLIVDEGRVAAVDTELGRIECDVVVNATGMWGAETARLAGADVAVGAVEHQYVVTGQIPGLPAGLPTFRDPDGRFYARPETGALAIGGWEDGTRAPWRTIPPDLGPELLPPDYERFEPIGEAAAHRLPVTADTGIRTWVNGPIPFSPDAEPLMGVTEDLSNVFHCCGFSAGIAAAGGAGHAMAAPAEFYLVTGAGFGRHDISFIRRHAPRDGSVAIRDVTSAYGVLSLSGPLARDIAGELTRCDLGNEAFSYLTARRIDLGHAPALALRASYTGELGWEFHVPAEYLRDLYERLLAAGAAAGLRDVGYRAVNSLRLEKQYLAWSADIKTDDNPYAAGLAFAVRPDKPGLLAGPALRKIRDEGPAERLCWFSTGADVVMHGGELLAHPGRDVAVSVRSAGYGYTVRRVIFPAYLPAALASETDFVVEVAGERYPAARHDAPLYDPAGTRIRG